jgi:DNA/RNA endonuclease YhcR with UshA esterase domain
MLVRQERVALALLGIVIAILAVSAFLLEASGRDPFAVQYNPGTPEGTLVHYEGVVESISGTRAGGHTILIVSGLKVFVPAACTGERAPRIGERVSVTGKVQSYQGEREILVLAAGDVKVT